MVVIGTSAGGVEALQTLISSLPKDFKAAVFVVLHLPPWSHSILDKLLSRKSSLLCTKAADKQPRVDRGDYRRIEL